ncbi:uncharacterized protein ALTATR162_LOCUS11717 [Alternaria atra]|uniref:Geranylgeranyl pyrophosphate synthetase n=1 Tax=Alternaria atra TaxID=119953 RepID=A0A8J2IG49_9PLEO|nr:uncharacterized protein ALTATR162_LOCUS11717 [Alternaria atra]CAG5187432.1 unnamed protein product [Alternaria atra]
MVSRVVATICRSDLSDRLDPAHATTTEFEYLASYSWLESEVPTILVPGWAPLWSPPAGPLKLEPDSGRVYIDQNAARSPDAPLEPLFGALSAQKPNFKMGSVDVITDRNNIRKLLRFLGGTSSESFQIRVEIVEGKRALFTRMENETTTVVRGFQGYGRNFEKACTKSATRTSGYYRITSFRFCGLQCVVRHETDGYIDDGLGRAAVHKQADMTDSLPQLLETLQLADSVSASKHTAHITVQKEGKEVDLSSIVEAKTRAASKSLDMDETAAQLWLSQTAHLAIGYHKNGLFNDVQIRDMTQNVRDWEKSNKKVLCSLGYLLNEIIEVVKNSASQVAVVRYDGGMKLEVIAGEQEKAPSEGVDANWQGEKQGIEDRTLMAEKGDQYKTPAQTNTPSCVMTPITVGKVRYEIDISRIPRLASLVLTSNPNLSQSTEIIHEAIPLFDVAFKGIESGYRQCFRLMSTDITSYRTLCDTYDFLHVDVCQGRTLSEIIKDLKAGQGYDEDRDKSKARDAAFKLAYFIQQDMFQSIEKHKNAIFNAVLFVVSHHGTFKWKTRNAVRAVYESKLTLSVKQSANLDQWHKLDYGEQADTHEVDGTTEEETSDWYDSDCSDFW